MVRELIEVEASGEGWMVKGEDAASSCATKLQAIEQAHTLATRRYVETGRPTAVRVPVTGGAAVIVGACG